MDITSSEGVLSDCDVMTLGYEPLLLGHSSDEQPPLETNNNAFWHQNPFLEFPDKKLYYYTGWGYFDRKVYIDHTSGQPLIISYRKPCEDRGTSFAQGMKKLPPHLTVDVYNGDDFVQRVPRHLLIRFSRVAADVLPKPARFTNGLSGNRPVFEDAAVSHADGAKTDDTCRTHEAEGDMTESTPSPPISSTVPSEYSVEPSPPRQNSSQPQSSFATFSQGLQRRQVLRYSMPVHYLPTNKAIKTALKWMHDNTNAGREDELPPFGPTDLELLEFEELIDLYATALMLSIRPTSEPITRALLNRLSNSSPLRYEHLVMLILALPAESGVINRAFSVFMDCQELGFYPQLFIKRFNNAMSQPENGDLKKQFRSTARSRHWKVVAEERQTTDKQPDTETDQDETSNEDEFMEGDVCKEAERKTQPEPEVVKVKGRRRFRRKQNENGKKRDKGWKKDHASGAQ